MLLKGLNKDSGWSPDLARLSFSKDKTAEVCVQREDSPVVVKQRPVEKRHTLGAPIQPPPPRGTTIICGPLLWQSEVTDRNWGAWEGLEEKDSGHC